MSTTEEPIKAEFGNRLALVPCMNNGEKLSIDEREWRRLCLLVSAEPDPQRLSELVDKLFKELDARREVLRECEK